MPFRDYSLDPAENETIGAGIYIGPDMARDDVREALQTLAADGRDVYEAMLDIDTGELSGFARASSVAALQAVAGPTAGMARYLAQSGKEGLFVFDASDLSAEVTADPDEAIYIAPTSGSTGASGAWVRKSDGFTNVKWFGAVGDGTTNDGAAPLASLSYLKTQAVAAPGFGYAPGSPRLYVPGAHYNLATSTVDITHTLIVEGDGTGEASGGGTVLKFSADTTAVRIQSANTSGATGTKVSDGYRGTSSIVRNLSLIGGRSTGDADYHGIHLRGTATIKEVYIENFQGDGINSVVSAGSGGATEGNANNIMAERVYIENCRRGVYLDGADVNAGLFSAINVKNARQQGIYDSSFLANTWLACHVMGSGLAAYKTDNINARNVLVGCYSESGQPASELIFPTTVIGGLHAAGITGDALLIGDPAGEGLAIKAPSDKESWFGKLRPRWDSGGTTADAAHHILNVHNVGALATFKYSQIGFSFGYEVDGVTPCDLGAIAGYSVGTNPATNEGRLVFSARAAGGVMTEHFELDGVNIALTPTANNVLNLGLTGTRFKKLWTKDVESTDGYLVGGTRVVGAQGAAITDAAVAVAAPTKAEFDALVGKFNTLLARLRAATGHGLIA